MQVHVPARRPAPRREIIRPDPQHSWRLGVHTPRHWSYVWHEHPEFELTLITHGSGLRHVGDSVQTFTAPDLVLIGPHLPHTWVSQPDGRPQRAIVAQWPADLGGMQRLPEFHGLAPLLAQASAGLHLGGPGAARIAGALEAAAVQTDPLARLADLFRLLSLLNREDVHRRPLASGALPAPIRSATARRRLQAALAALHHHDDATAARAARAAGMSLAGFSRFFRRQVGVGYAEHRAHVRLAQAQHLLRTSTRSITGIAFAVGFGSISAFNRAFVRHLGCSPRQWRARHG